MNRLSGFIQPESLEDIDPAAFNYKNWRERFIRVVLRIASVLGVGLILIALPNATLTDRILFSTLYLTLLAVTFLPVPYKIKAYAFLAAILIIGINATLAWGPWIDASLFYIAFVTMSALLLDSRADVISLGISLLSLAVIGTLQQLGIYQLTAASKLETTAFGWLAYAVDLAIPSVLIIIAIDQFKQEFAHIAQKMQDTFNALLAERAQLESRVNERTEALEQTTLQLRSSTTVARTVAEIQGVDALMEGAVTLTASQFDFYHVGLYLLDERKRTAYLQAASSEIGKRLIGQGLRVEPDRRDAFNMVIEEKRYYIISGIQGVTLAQGAEFERTRSRLILPLNVRNEIVGLLDIHSDKRDLKPEDAEVLQTLADLVAISIDNARLLNETKALLAQLEAYTSIQTRETWGVYTSRNTPAFQYTPAGVRPIFNSSKKGEEPGGLVVPLVLQGQEIGKIRLRRKGMQTNWSERERNLVEKIAEQVALALENSRLVEEAQKNAQRDQLIANISGRIRETLDVESVIRTAASEIRRVFDLKEAEIDIGSPQASAPATKKQTSSLRLK